jgi:replicative DNA helicase
VFEALETRGTRFLRGQLALVAAGPGTGKSAFVLTYALKAGVPTLYFSADSDAFTQSTRSISILTGWSLEASARAVRNEDLGEAAEVFKDIPIRFNYSASPTLSEIENSIQAYDEVYGDYPALIVIDNVTNVISGGNDDDPFAGLEALMDYLHGMARDTGALVIGLHHVTGGYNDADKPIPLSGVKGQITRVPELVITLHRKASELDFGVDTLYVSTVKNRGGKSDPSGVDAAELEFIGDTMQIRDFMY